MIGLFDTFLQDPLGNPLADKPVLEWWTPVMSGSELEMPGTASSGDVRILARGFMGLRPSPAPNGREAHRRQEPQKEHGGDCGEVHAQDQASAICLIRKPGLHLGVRGVSRWMGVQQQDRRRRKCREQDAGDAGGMVGPEGPRPGS